MITKEELIENIEILADKCEELIKERGEDKKNSSSWILKGWQG
jgi:hypothetical protein